MRRGKRVTFRIKPALARTDVHKQRESNMSERDEKKRDGTRYKHDPVWADVVPLPPDDGFPNALATIAYTEEYAEASAYLRAVMAANEFSQRALDLTAHLIKLNPAHYTVW